MLLVPEETRKRIGAEREARSDEFADARAILQHAGLRPTRQRLAIGKLLFRGDHRHVTADDLHRDVLHGGEHLSLATVYNTLNQFAEAGLVRRISVNGGRSYFDTDAGDHQHFYVESEDRILDVPENSIRFDRLPPPPDGFEIAGVDVVIRLSAVATLPTTPCGRECARCEECATTLDLTVDANPLLRKMPE